MLAGLSIGVGVIVAVFLLIALGLAGFIFMVAMLIDCITHKVDNKLAWLLIILLAPFGFLFYYFLVKRKGKSSKPSKEIEMLALLSFVFGLIGFWFFIYFGLVFFAASLILGFVALGKIENKKNLEGKDLVEAGMIIGGIGFAFQVLAIIFYFMFFAFMIGAGFFSGLQESSNDLAAADSVYPGPLEAVSSYIGYDTTDGCVAVNRTFSKDETVCFQPIVKGFTLYPEGFYYFDMDKQIFENSTGKIIEHKTSLWGEEGWAELDNGVLDSYYLIYPLENVSSGNYVFEAIIYDKHTGDSVIASKSFRVE